MPGLPDRGGLGQIFCLFGLLIISKLHCDELRETYGSKILVLLLMAVTGW